MARWLMVLILSICFCTSGCDDVLDDSRTYDYDDYAYRMLEVVNEERSREGLDPVEYSVELSEAAMIRAEDITVYFEHTRPDGSDAFSVVENKKDYYDLGENIARGHETPEEVVEAWMGSPGHRRNIMDPDFNLMGFGYFYTEDDDMDHWVQIFGVLNDDYSEDEYYDDDADWL